MAEIKRNITYINKDFNDFRTNLINYTKTYFPKTYTDFSPASPGMLFMEQASYVGDVLSFYLDNQIQENFLQYSKQTNNIYDIAYMYGYKPKTTALATAPIDIFQLVPSKVVSGSYIPDYSYAIEVKENSEAKSTGANTVKFTIQDSVDFSTSSSLDPTVVSVAQTSNNNPSFFLLKKTRQAISGDIKTTTFNFGAYQEFPTVDLVGSNIAKILDVVDSDGNVWYEVDYLGQDAIYDSVKNTNVNDPAISNGEGDAPYLLQLKRVQRRFATRFINNTTLQLQFGSGNSEANDEEIVPNSDNVGLGLPYEQDKLTTAYSPTNFIFTNTYGIAPSNTTLTVRYIVGSGVSSNVDANTINTLDTSKSNFLRSNLNATTAQYVFNSISVSNPQAASGGGSGDSITEIRQNAISNFSTQLRNVTADDYLVRTLSMPAKFGDISKAFVEKPKGNYSNTTLDIYTLTYDSNKKLKTATRSLKENLKTYLNQYKMVGDSVSIKDAFIINIAVDFEIITLPNYNNNEVLRACIEKLISFFNIDNWQINEPIILRNINVLLDEVQGVQTVKRVTITNKAGVTSGYSRYGYDILGATQNGVIYPSLDASVFEVKYPNQDITGKVSTF